MASSNPSSWKVKALHMFTPGPKGAEPKNDKVYVAVIDRIGPDQYKVSGYYGKRTKEKLTQDAKDTHGSLAAAERQMDGLVGEKVGKGYVDVTTSAYSSGKVPGKYRTSLNGLMGKIDTTRIVGFADPPQTAAAQSLSAAINNQSTEPKSAVKMPTKAPVATSAKADRGIKL